MRKYINDDAEKSAQEEVTVSEDQQQPQQEQTPQAQEQSAAEAETEHETTGESGTGAETSAAATPAKRRVRRKPRKYTEEELLREMPKSSIYPLALALSLIIMLAGALWNMIIFGIGVILVIAIIIGWSLERK